MHAPPKAKIIKTHQGRVPTTPYHGIRIVHSYFFEDFCADFLFIMKLKRQRGPPALDELAGMRDARLQSRSGTATSRWCVLARQTRALAKKNLLQLLRRKRSFLLEVLAPVLLVSLLGVLDFAKRNESVDLTPAPFEHLGAHGTSHRPRRELPRPPTATTTTLPPPLSHVRLQPRVYAAVVWGPKLR